MNTAVEWAPTAIIGLSPPTPTAALKAPSASPAPLRPPVSQGLVIQLYRSPRGLARARSTARRISRRPQPPAHCRAGSRSAPAPAARPSPRRVTPAAPPAARSGLRKKKNYNVSSAEAIAGRVETSTKSKCQEKVQVSRECDFRVRRSRHAIKVLLKTGL